jgi:hypothetical protein
MKKSLRATVAVAVVLTAAALAAAGGAAPEPNNQLSIEPTAQYRAFIVDVAFHVRCGGGIGVVNMKVTQQPPESTAPATGTGGSTVVCDGQQREFVVQNCCGGFNLGRAFASATLVAPSGTATDSREINITF